MENFARVEESRQKRWPWFVIPFFALLMWCAASAVSLKLDPEAEFWKKVVEQKLTAADGLREAAGPEQAMIFVGGGSSCSFSIHPDVLEEETGMPAVNLGGSAGMGYRYLIDLATCRARRGDVVILHLEPEILVASERPLPPLAIKVDLSRGLTGTGRGVFGDSLYADPLTEKMSALRPGAKFLGTLAGKMARGGSLYRYQLEQVGGNGVLGMTTTTPNADIEPFQSMQGWLEDEEVQKDLAQVSSFAEKEGFSIYYTLPWEVFQAGAIESQRKEHASALAKMRKFLPVLSDEVMGATSENSWFLDTGYHMNREAGRERTRVLARSLMDHLQKGS